MRYPRRALAWLATFAAAFCILILALSNLPAWGGQRPASAVRVDVGAGHGSGVHLGFGLVLTAAHVIADETSIDVVTEHDATFKAESLWSDTDYDVAAIYAGGLDVPSAQLSCRPLIVGERIETRGNPLSMGFTSTWGRIAAPAMKRGDRKMVAIADLTVAPGNSGGPVYHRDGLVAGIVVAIALVRMNGGYSTVALSYIVPSDAICGLFVQER